MKTKILKIFSTICVLAALTELSAGTFSTAGEAEKDVPEQLTATANRLVRLFRSPWNSSRTGLTVAFSPAVPEYSAEVMIRGGVPTLMLNGSADLRRNILWRRKVYGAILLAAAGGRLNSGETLALPPWLTPALDRILEAREYEERLLVGNSRSPVLGALLENGRLPASGQVLRIDPERFDPAAAAWARELSRALFVSGGRNFASPEFLRQCGNAAATGRTPRVRKPRSPERMERDFVRAARHLAWHALAPRPARWTRKKFGELRKLKLPVLDDKGNPTDKFEEFDVLELAGRLRGRPDAHQRCLEFRRSFADFASGDSRPAQQAFLAFAELVGQAEDPPFRYEARLRRQLELIRATLARQEKLDDYMKREDLRRAPARRAFRVRLEYIGEFNAASPQLSEAARRWVDECEAKFR